MSPELVITRGLPASGKTTYARAWVAIDPQRRARVNRDDLRFNLYGIYFGLTPAQEDRVTDVQTAAVRALLARGVSVVVDDTHLRLAHAKRWGYLARELGAGFIVDDYRVSADECVERDEARRAAGERAVGEDVIRALAKRYGLKGDRWLPPVDVDEEPVRRYEPNPALPDCWLVDVDGTLAHMRDRSPFEWHRVGEDDLDDRVAALAEHLTRPNGIVGAALVVVSGRDAVCRAETEEWLEAHGVDYDALFMRGADDMRKDALVKAEIFWNDVAPRWNVLGVLDDRDQVVAMWRGLGLLCLQVAPGAF